MSDTESNSTALLKNRGVDLVNITEDLPRPLEMINESFEITLELPQETKIQFKNGETFQGTLELPTRLSASNVPPLPSAYEKIFAGIVEGTTTDGKKVNVAFDKEVILTLPAIGKTAIDPANLKVLYFDESTKEYVLAAGNGGKVSADGKSISVKVPYTGKFVVVNTNGIDLDQLSQMHFSANGASPFNDINDHWAKNYIIRLYDLNIVKGRATDQFAPDANVTRAELVKIALTAFDYEIPEKVTQNPFRDVEVQDWYAPYVQAARDTGILQGYIDGTFRPNQAVNRAESLKIILEAAKLSATDADANFEDVDKNAWFAKYVAYAKTQNIVAGYEIAGANGQKVGDIYSFNRYLGQGDQGEDVGNLQKALQSLGFYKGTISNTFDTQTETALSQYQLSKGLATAGSFGPQTKNTFLNETLSTEKKYLFKPEQSVTRAEIAKIALKILDLKSLVQNKNQTSQNTREEMLQATRTFFDTIRQSLI